MIDLAIVCVKWPLVKYVVNWKVSRRTSHFAASLLILLLGASASEAQQSSPSGTSDVPAPSTSFASQFFEHDFVNVYAFGNGLWDSSLPQLSNGGAYGSSFGYDVGGGISLGHQLKQGNFSLSYRGDYRHYEGTSYSNGTNQSLSLLFQKRLNRQWSILLQGSGGLISYGGQIYSESSQPGTSLTNPLSSESRFANGGITLTYQQTRRLSYTMAGQFFYNSFSYAGAVSSVGGTGTGSVNYRTTARTTVGGSYSHTYFSYAGTAGTSSIDSGFLTLQHTFSGHWFASVSAGVSRSHSQGIITFPVTLVLDQQLVSGYVTGPYNHTTLSPSFQASVTRNIRHAYFSVSGGQGINAGNGTLLASKNQFIGSTFSLSHRLTNFSFGGGYSKLISVANTVSENYTSATASVSYGFPIVHYLSGNLRYDFTHYADLYSLHGVNDNRISLGLSFSSKSVPLTLF
jgi:hypothetical protein